MAQGARFELDHDGLDRLYLIGNEFTADIVDEIADDMRRIVPIDTGDLHDSIEHITVDGRGVISVGTDYWSYVEFGTSKMAAQPFVRPSVYRKRRGA